MVARWERPRPLSFLPPLVLLLALPVRVVLGGRVLVLRFHLNRAEYELVAKEVVAGTYPQELRPEHRHLALKFWPQKLDGKVEGVLFIVVSHGFAGHRVFFYAADSSNVRQALAADDTFYFQAALSEQWALARD